MLLTVCLASSLLLGGCGGDSQVPNSGEVSQVQVEVEEGRVQGPGQVTVSQEMTVRIEVTSDVAGTVHVHGYEIFREVSAGGRVEVGFKAAIAGVYEVELHPAELLLLRLEVSP